MALFVIENITVANTLCYAAPSKSNLLECANGKSGQLWAGCADQGSHRVRCPQGYFPCNERSEYGAQFSCWEDCTLHEGVKDCHFEGNFLSVEICQKSVSTLYNFAQFYATNTSYNVFSFPLKVNSGNSSKTSKTPEYLLKRRNSNQPSTKTGKNTNQSML